MPCRQISQPHLYLRPERRKPDGRLKERAYWVIKDGNHEESTQCGQDRLDAAHLKLAEYLSRKHVRAVNTDQRDPAEIPVADVIAFYAVNKVPGLARPKEVSQRLNEVLEFFKDDMLLAVNGDTCREFAAGNPAKRRALEDLRAAINYHRKEGKCSKVIEVVLPPRYIPRERWLTRPEAAQLLWYCWRREHLKHIAKFILVALYTGTRASAVCGSALKPSTGRGWLDLDHGIFYRRPSKTRATKKRQPAIRLPSRLLCHLRIWSKTQDFAVEWHGRPVKRISKGFRGAVEELKLDDVVVHTLRHTAITWAMQRGMDMWEACGYFGITMEMLQEVYGHHHPDHQATARKAFDRPANLPKRA